MVIHMKNVLKRLFSLLLVLALAASMLPTVLAAENAEEATELTAADYAAADAVFAQIDAMELEPAKKNASQSVKTDAAIAIVQSSDSYVAGSLERNGDAFNWWTEEGIRCAYSPRMRKIQEEMVAPENPIADGIYNEPKATKGGWPSGNQVYLIGPYYGKDPSFTDQYKNEAKAIATAIGDTDGYTLYSGSAATIDKVAEAISNGAVVIFDSHGTTDYESGSDYVTGAKYSYLCLTTKSGVTDADYADGAEYYGTDTDGNPFMAVNGAAIANHMTKNSPGGLLWMAICLGMATDTFPEALRPMGVEVVYGYSQSVTFDGDYLFEETFWDNMIAGKDVATSIAAMKSKWGNWDWSQAIWNYYENAYSDMNEYPPYTTIAEARADYAAFPIVVSDEDTHPGQRKGTSSYGADSLQTVKSTYTLYSQYDISATSSNTAYGTVSVNGSTITATPAEGYFAQGATVTSGTATVTQNGNTFSVMAESDCTVQINFAAKTPVAVTFSGATVTAQSGYAGDAMTLPAVEAPDGYTFLGWMTAPLSENTTEKPSFYENSFTPTGNTTLYALYSFVDANSGTGTGDYVKVTESRGDWSGEYVIVYEADGYIFDGSLTSFDATSNYKAVTITNGTIAAADADAYKFTVAAMDGGYSIQGTSGKYIGHASNANGLTTGDAALKNTISLDATGNANIIGAGGAYLRYNKTSGQDRFRYYKSSSYTNQQPIALYLKDGSAGTTYYTGSATVCEHTNTTEIAAVAPTCTTTGYAAGVQCADCGNIISGHEIVNALGHSWGEWIEITAPGCTTTGEEARECATCGETKTESVPATGHSYTSVVTPPTATEQGYTTHTCGNCGDSYVDAYVEALGQTYTVSFAVPQGVSAVESMLCGKSGIILPEAGIPDDIYTFAGWAAAAVDDTTEAPDFYAAGSTYTAAENTTLYALYTYAEISESGSGDYKKVTAAPTDWSGQYLIVYEAGSLIFDGSLEKLDATGDKQNVTITDSTISAAQGDAYSFTVAAMDGGYSIQSASGVYIGRSAKSNGLDEGTSAKLNTISLNADGSVNIIGSGGAYLRYNKTSGQDRFRYYKSSSYSSQQPIALYKKDGAAATIHYTTGNSQAPVTAEIKSASVTLDSVLGVNFIVEAPDGCTVKIAVGDGAAADAALENGVCTVSVYAEDMMQPITAALYDAQGNLADSATFTLATYAANVSADARALAAATLTYCQYAAKVQGKYSGDMNTLDAIPENAFADFGFPTVGPKGVSAYANLKDTCGLYLRLPETYAEGYTFTVDGAEATLSNGSIGVAGILPQEYGDSHTFAIYKDGTEFYSCTFSVLGYVGKCLSKGLGSDDMQNLMTAMYHYYAAAAAYTPA